MRGVDSGMGACCFRDLDVNKSNIRNREGLRNIDASG